MFAARGTEFLRGLEHKTLDWRFRNFCRPSKADTRIVLVMLDQASLDHFEKDEVYWPWPRSMYAAALDFLKQAGAKAVVMDLLFTSPSPYGAAEDETLGRAVKRYGRFAAAMEMGASPHPLRRNPPPARFAVEPPPELRAAAVHKEAARLPQESILRHAAFLGDTSAAPDQDGVFRRLPLFSEMGGRVYPSLAAAAALAAGGSLEGLPLADGRLLVNFHGSALAPNLAKGLKTYAVYSLGDLILARQALEEGKNPALDPAAFKDRIVFIGANAAGLLDNRPSPISPVFPGTEILAAAADNILNRDFLAPAGAAAALILIVFGTLGAAAAARLPKAGMAAAAGLSLVLAGVAVLAFRRGVWTDMAGPQLALWLSFAGVSAYSYAVEGRKKRYIQSAFSHYISADVVEQISKDPEKLALGGERREVSFYFSDIEGFTSFSEKLDPERLAALMNRYLGVMTDTVMESGGTLDKYIGDAVMAFWGAPLPVPDHALRACRTALANQKKLVALNEELAKDGFPRIAARIGLNSGTASIGNMGCAKRFNYTAIGDNVNLASRLEGANKSYNTYVMISESTRELAADAIETRELDFVRVKGKNKPIRVYELIGIKGRTDEALLRKARAFERGLADYRAQEWDKARATFEAVIREFNGDGPSEVFAQRCRAFKAEPPDQPWDGVYAMTEK